MQAELAKSSAAAMAVDGVIGTSAAMEAATQGNDKPAAASMTAYQLGSPSVAAQNFRRPQQ